MSVRSSAHPPVPGGIIRIRIWLVTRDRRTWVTGSELVVLAWIVVAAPPGWIRLLLGAPLVLHVGYRALTSLPLGAIPGRPDGAKQHRRNQDLRSLIVGFLNEVRAVESYAQRAMMAGIPRARLEPELRKAQRKLTKVAAEMIEAIGRAPPEVPVADAAARARAKALLTHGVPLGALQPDRSTPVVVTRGLRDSAALPRA